MAQIDSYLSRIANENTYSFQEDFYDLYDFVPNSNLRTLLAVYHTQLNKWFATMNSDLRYEFDDDGNRINKGGYFHAQDSRDFLDVIDSLDQLRTKCNSTEYSFQFCNEKYANTIKQCRRFVVKSGGSSIPEGFGPIEIVDLSPIFNMVKSVGIANGKQTIYANLKSIGEGSYARVFSYIDPTYSIPIVLKRAKPDLDEKELARFKQEFEVLKSLHSPYVVEVYTYSDEKHEYTMEHMDESIYGFVRKHNSNLSLADRKRIIFQIVKGLSYIHKKGYLHRDISLTNVFIKHYDDVDVVKIGDFGLVKNPESTLTSLQSEMKGSLNDPDLINVGFGNYTMCHETFALTRLCFFVLTGKTNIDKQKNGQIKDFWNRGTNPDKSQRFQSVDELATAVQQIKEEQPQN